MVQINISGSFKDQSPFCGLSPILMAYGYVHLYPKKSPKITSVRCDKICSIQKKTPKPGYSKISPANWWFQPLWKIWKSVGIIIPNIWKKIMFQTTNQKISPVLDIRNGASNHQCCFKSPQQIPAFLSISQIPCKKWKHSWWISRYSMIFPYQKTSCWLVVSTCFNPSEKYEWVRQLGWCFLPNWMESHKINMFQTFPNQGSVSTQSIHPVFGLPWDDPRRKRLRFLRFRPSFRKVPTALSKAAAKTLAVSLPVSRAKSWRQTFGGTLFIRNEDFPWEFTTKYWEWDSEYLSCQAGNYEKIGFHGIFDIF